MDFLDRQIRIYGQSSKIQNSDQKFASLVNVVDLYEARHYGVLWIAECEIGVEISKFEIVGAPKFLKIH